jgi:archaemetzincin
VEEGEPTVGAVALIPVGPVSPDLLAWLQRRLVELPGRHVIVSEGISLPGNGYSELRRQYRGAAILDTLRAVPYPGAGRVLGLTDADFDAPALNYMYGQATLHGPEAFVALPPLRPSFYRLPEDPDLPTWRERALKECVQELGHTWGLRHCRDARCVIHFSNSLLDPDAEGVARCSRCGRRLEDRVGSTRARAATLWLSSKGGKDCL